MYKIKNWMCENDWTEGNYNNDMKQFLTVECKIEDPVALNNPTCAIQLSLNELSFKERIKIMTDILEENLKDKEFFFCEYGSIGMCYKQKYIKGHYNKENCIEFDTFYPGEGLSYTYKNITFIKVDKNTFKYRKYIKRVVLGKTEEGSYYIVDLNGKMVIRVYDYRGLVLLSKDENQLNLWKKKYAQFIPENT